MVKSKKKADKGGDKPPFYFVGINCKQLNNM